MKILRILRLFSCFLLLFAVCDLKARSLCVGQATVELHREPSDEAPVSWTVFRYMPLKMLDKKDGWYRVQNVDGKVHWIDEQAVHSSFECAVISNEYAHLRTGPGTKHPKFSKAKRGEKYLSFRVLGYEGDWVRLEDADGDIVWVHRPLLWIP